jgi:hypothetical protein
MLPCELTQERCRQHRGVAKRLFVIGNDTLEVVEVVWRYLEKVMLRTEMVGNRLREYPFVVFFLGKSDGKGLDLRRADTIGKRTYQAGVEPPGKKHADGYIRHQAPLNRRGKVLPQRRACLFVATGKGRGYFRPPVRIDREITGYPFCIMSGRQLRDALVDATRLGNVLIFEIIMDRRTIDRGIHPVDCGKGRRAAGECETITSSAVKQRFLPEPVAGDKYLAGIDMQYRKRKHTIEFIEHRRPLVLVKMQENLGIALRSQDVTVIDQAAAQLAVVINLAIEHQRQGAVFVVQRLVPAHYVDDRKATMHQPGRTMDNVTKVVRAALGQRCSHGFEQLPIRRVAWVNDTGDAAHS